MLTSSSAPKRKLCRTFNDRQAIDKALKQAQADVQYAAASRAFDKGDMDGMSGTVFPAPFIPAMILRNLFPAVLSDVNLVS